MENSIKEDIERLKLCSTNQCYICGRYEKEECMLERNRCEQHILSDYKRVLKENEELKNEVMEKDLELIGKEEYTKASMGKIIEHYYTANSVIQNKINEYKNTFDMGEEWYTKQYIIEVLQELLERDE